MKLRYLFAALCLCLLLVSPAAAAGGSGTAADPYVIQTAAELQSIQNNLAAYYQLGADIDLSTVSWTPIGSTSAPFSGQLDGNGKTIKNLNLQTTTQSCGFFGVITSGATIKDITFKDCIVSSTGTSTGLIIGSVIMSSSAHNTALISNVNCIRCSVSSSYGVGCFAGTCSMYSLLTIDSSTVQNSIISCSGGSSGGFIGACSSISSVNVLNSNIINCVICGTTYIGGIAGLCDTAGETQGSSVSAQTCTVIKCTIVGSGNFVGGLAGRIVSGSTGVFSTCTITDNSIIALQNYAASICPAFS